MIMDNKLISAIENLDVAAVQECLKVGADITGISLTLVIEQFGEADEDTFWGAPFEGRRFSDPSKSGQTQGCNCQDAY